MSGRLRAPQAGASCPLPLHRGNASPYEGTCWYESHPPWTLGRWHRQPADGFVGTGRRIVAHAEEARRQDGPHHGRPHHARSGGASRGGGNARPHARRRELEARTDPQHRRQRDGSRRRNDREVGRSTDWRVAGCVWQLPRADPLMPRQSRCLGWPRADRRGAAAEEGLRLDDRGARHARPLLQL